MNRLPLTLALLWILSGLPTFAQLTFSIEFDYDPLGQMSRLTYPDNSYVDYGYDNELGLASHITYKLNGVTYPFISEVDFNASGLVTSVTTDGGLKEYTFDSLDQLTSARFTHNGIKRYEVSEMTYNELGYLASAKRSDPSVNATLHYDYTAQGQLRTFGVVNRINAAQATYRYDKNGNLTSIAGFQHGTLSVSDQGIVEYDDRNHHEDWLYDQAGRVIQDDEFQYFYDPSGRVAMVQELHTDIPLFSYLYDGQGNRVRTTNIKEGSVTYTIRDKSGTIISEKIDRTMGPDETINYIHQNGVLVGTVRYVQGNPEPIKTQVFHDHLGSPAVSVTGGSVTQNEYGPFGQQLRTPTHTGPYGYTGHEDDPTGRTYMRARYYDPGYARFLAPDPGRAFNVNLAATYNLYAYVSNNPINKTDPFGLVETGKQWANRLASEAFTQKSEVRGYFYKGLSGLLGTADGISKVTNYWVFGKADELTGWDYAGATFEFLDVTPAGKLNPFKNLNKFESVVDSTGNILDAAQDVKPLVSMTGKTIHKIGQAGEAAVRSLFDIGPKKMIFINGRKRIPDGMTGDVLTEVKNVKYLSYTRQLRDYADFARENGLTFQLFIRRNTKLSRSIREALARKEIILRYIPE